MPKSISEEEEPEQAAKRRPGQYPLVGPESGGTSSSSGSNQSEPEQAFIRGRAGFRGAEIRLIPANIDPSQLRAKPDGRSRPIDLLCNYIELSALENRHVYQYRIDFEPEIDSLSLRRKLFMLAFKSVFNQKIMFDGMHDARSGVKIDEQTIVRQVAHPTDKDPDLKVSITIKLVGNITGGFEMIRIYNINMKAFLRALGFYQISSSGAYIHPKLSNQVGNVEALMTVRGFRTAANVHEGGKILMNLESVHKLMQRKNVFENMIEIRANSRGNLQEELRAALVGKLVVTNYNKIAYKIEDINFKLSPKSTFEDRRAGEQVSYVDYYQRRYGIEVKDKQQPLLLVIQSNKRRGQRELGGDEESTQPDVYLIPEFCNIAGLMDCQRNDNRLKIDLVKSSQLSPNERVAHIRTFLSKFHENSEIQQALDQWSYGCGKEMVGIRGRQLAPESIGLGPAARGPADRWTKADASGSFDRAVQCEKLAMVPELAKMCVIISRTDFSSQGQILSSLQAGFEKVGLSPSSVNVIRISEGDSAQLYVNCLKQLAPDVTATLVIIHAQNKERYDAIKKMASVERGMISQVVTARLMTDPRKASGAAIKIGIQVAAKIGGEPWLVQVPLPNTMICGYDTYHDTANRGRSFGAFVASTNSKFTRWFSKADAHDRLDELSSHICENLGASLRKYREVNDRWPERVILYRDGVSDGQLEQVFEVEVKQISRACEECDKSIRLTIVIVNKRIGARFYMRTSGDQFANPPPGSVVDSVVTRQERYDFYLVSQSTRHGTVAPTYYNIIHDESGLDAAKHQLLAFKLCFLYFNWPGTVRVPAPCQYAHKLALLCGEHLHTIPNANLDNRLHFL